MARPGPHSTTGAQGPSRSRRTARAAVPAARIATSAPKSSPRPRRCSPSADSRRSPSRRDRDRGVSRATFYIYFESKYGPVAALAEEVTEEIYETLWKPFVSGEETPSGRLVRDPCGDDSALGGAPRVLVAAGSAWRADPAGIDQWRALWNRYVGTCRC